MCTLFIYRTKNTDWPILLATNRDEFLSRKFYSPNYHWRRFPSIFAGKDQLKGGSWLGINKYGVCTAILNRPSVDIDNKNLTSRGNIIIDVLKNKTSMQAKNIIIKKFKKNTKYFNLFISDYENAFWIKYYANQLSVFNIPYGYSIIDNFDLNDSNSDKQIFYKTIFEKTQLPDPDKRNFDSWKKLLFYNNYNKKSNIPEVFITNYNKNYGTVCSSIIGLPNKKINNKKIIWLYSERKKNFLNLLPFKNK